MLSIEALAQTNLFAGIERDSVEGLWALGKVARRQAGERLFDRGDAAHALLILESGSAQLLFPVPILGVVKEIVVECVGPGDVVAWSALVSPYVLTLSARCVEASQVRSFARSVLGEYLARHPPVGYLFMRNLAGVIGRRLQDFQNLWIREVQAKLAEPSD